MQIYLIKAFRSEYNLTCELQDDTLQEAKKCNNNPLQTIRI